ncbi:MAG: NAD(P)H-binding protein [Rhodoferax sp.]|nr:NAD(P)H-binding protein [Rhodoferax sp.]
MKIAIIGAGGKVGRPIAQEAQDRGHEVIALLRPNALGPSALARAAGAVDIFDSLDLARAVRGCDAIVSAYGAPAGALQLLPAVAASVVSAARQAAVRRVLLVGGAGILEVAPGVRLADTPGFPAALMPKVKAHADAIAVLRRAADLDWTCVAPAAQIGPGARSGRYRTAVDALVADEAGRSCISYGDFACALLDELQACRYPRQLLGVGD